MSSFFTLLEACEDIYKEKGSKFLAFAYPIIDEDDAKAKIIFLKKKYYDATHHCFAYNIHTQDQAFYRTNDDGEPAHSAGTPIWGQIRSHNLANVLVVVVRYYGGTKLGVGGLINAYKTATQMALDNGKTIEKYFYQNFILHFEYPQMNDVMKQIKNFDAEITHQNFELACVLHVKVRMDLKDDFQEKVKNWEKT